MAILITIYILIGLCVWALAAQKMAEDVVHGHEGEDPFDYFALTFFSLCFAIFWPMMLALYILSLPVKYLLTRKK